MIAVAAVFIAAPFAVSAAVVRWLPRLLDRYMVARGPQGKSAVLSATLVPSPRELPGRPSAASTARQIYVITDAKEGR